MRAYTRARDDIHNPDVKANDYPDDIAHWWAIQVQYRNQFGRWSDSFYEESE